MKRNITHGPILQRNDVSWMVREGNMNCRSNKESQSKDNGKPTIRPSKQLLKAFSSQKESAENVLKESFESSLEHLTLSPKTMAENISFLLALKANVDCVVLKK